MKPAAAEGHNILPQLCPSWLQVVFAGVFLLTRASQPGAAGGGAGKTAEQASSSSRIAYVKDEALQALRPTAVAASDDPQWELAAVRPAGSGEQGWAAVIVT